MASPQIYAKKVWAGSDSNQRPPPCQGFCMQGVTTGCNVDGWGRHFKSDPAILRPDDSDDNGLWLKFEQYILGRQNPHTAKDTLRYASRYAHVLEQGNAQDLLDLPNEKRTHIMKALANLSKFLGCYHRWKEIRERYQLKWSNDYSLEVFEGLFNGEQSYSHMIAWLKGTYKQLPRKYGNILVYNTLTGLRPQEACQSLYLLHNKPENYYREDRMVLEHYKFPEYFIRRTKKAYFSVVTDKMLSIAKEADINHGYNAIKLAVKRRKLDMHMNFCRKIFATHLRMNGIEQEFIDLLQGRMPRTVFARH